MKKIYSLIVALFAMLTLSANAAEVPGNGATVTASTIYALPIEGENGYVADNMLKIKESVQSGQYIVAFLNAPQIASAIDLKNIFYNDNDRQYTGSEVINSNDNTFSYRRFYQAGPQNGIDIYAEDMNKVGSGYTWCYVIVNNELEATTVANPADKGSDRPAVPGQNIANALQLTDGQDVTFNSYLSGNDNVLYVKFKAEKTGTATINLYNIKTTYGKWMEEGVMAYGALKQNEFFDDNKLKVEEGKTYYCYYKFPSAQTNRTIKLSIAEAGPGEARAKAILISGDGKQNLLGVAPRKVNVDETEYTNTTTWFKLDGSALSGNDVMSITIGGNNQTFVSVFVNDDKMPIKSYGMGSAENMLAKNSTVLFDINLSANEYYVAIDQDNINGTADFKFMQASPGMTISTAIACTTGRNTTKAGSWYKYTHNGDDVITISGVNDVRNENEGLIADASDASSVGFRMSNGDTVYFIPSGSTVNISSRAISAGEYPDMPLVITGNFSIKLSGGSSDTQRYMQYTATANGTFMYGTSNTTVVESAFGAMVRDMTTGTVVDITKEERSYTSKMYVYEWHVEKDHTYLIEQTLQNGMGTVNFQTSFTKDNPTAVNAIETDDNDTASYNIAGQRVNANSKGIVIHNGKKFVK